MKTHSRSIFLPLFPAVAGCAGLALQFWLRQNTDEKGLLPASHPAAWLTLGLCVLVLAVILLHVRKMPPKNRYEKLFPPSPIRAAGCLVAAAGVLYAAIGVFNRMLLSISIVILITGILSVLSLVYIALCRLKGMRPWLPCHSIVTIYLMFSAVLQARAWSSQPQLHLYLYPLLATIFLMLTAYHQAQLALQKGHRRLVFFSQAALLFSLIACCGENWPFYAAMSLWMVTDTCVYPKRTRYQPRHLKEG